MRLLAIATLLILSNGSFASNLSFGTQSNKFRLIVLDFNVQEGACSLEQAVDDITASLEKEFASSHSIILIDRVKYESALSEVRYRIDGDLFFLADAKRILINQIKATIALIGDISSKGGEVLIRARLVDIQSSRNLIQGNVKIESAIMHAPRSRRRKMELLGKELVCGLESSIPGRSVNCDKDVGAAVSLGSIDVSYPAEFCHDTHAGLETFKIVDHAELSNIWLGGIGVPLDQPGSPGLYLLNAGSRDYSPSELEAIRQKITNIFLVFVLDPLANMAVDLHPTKDFGGVHEDLVGTELGRDLLYQDVELKRTVASILKPSTDYAVEFWKIYEREKDLFEESGPNIRVWIEPGKLIIKESQEGRMIKYTLEKMGFDLFADLEGLKNEHSADSRLLSYFKKEILPKVKDEVHLSDNFKILRQLLSIAMFAKQYEKLMGESLRRFYEKNPIPVHTSEQFEGDLVSIKEDYLDSYRNGIWKCHRNMYDQEQQSFVNRMYISGKINFSRIPELMQVTRFPQEPVIPGNLLSQWSLATIPPEYEIHSWGGGE